MSRRPRHPTAEERRLWERAMERTRRLQTAPPELPRTAASPDGSDAAPAPPPIPRPPRMVRVPQAAVPSRPAAPPAPESQAQMDRRNLQRLRRGLMRIEGRLDLHGLTLAEAHPVLSRFVLEAHAAGKRTLLVITGKGRGAAAQGFVMGMERGVLRRQLPVWLGRPPLSSCVLRVEQAARRHGGEGAFYVYLRRRRGGGE